MLDQQKMQALSEIRALQGISVAAVATMLGVSAPSVSRFEVGIPAISADTYLPQICSMLSINPDFLNGKTDYPFIPGSFLRFYVRGLKSRVYSLAWLEVIMKYAEKVDLICLLRRKNNNIVAVVAKDNQGSIFLISIEIPLPVKTLFDCLRERYASDSKHKADATAIEYFDSKGELGVTPIEDLKNFNKLSCEALIERELSKVLSESEQRLIAKIRKANMSADEAIEKLGLAARNPFLRTS